MIEKICHRHPFWTESGVLCERLRVSSNTLLLLCQGARPFHWFFFIFHVFSLQNGKNVLHNATWLHYKYHVFHLPSCFSINRYHTLPRLFYVWWAHYFFFLKEKKTYNFEEKFKTYPAFRCTKRFGALLFYLDLWRFVDNHSYSWMERVSVRVNWLTQQRYTKTWPWLKPWPFDLKVSALIGPLTRGLLRLSLPVIRMESTK